MVMAGLACLDAEAGIVALAIPPGAEVIADATAIIRCPRFCDKGRKPR